MLERDVESRAFTVLATLAGADAKVVLELL